MLVAVTVWEILIKLHGIKWLALSSLVNANKGLGIVNRVFLLFPVSAEAGTATGNGQLKEGKVIALIFAC